MGAFLLISDKKRDFDTAASLDMITRQCGTSPEYHSLKGFRLYSFPKRHSPTVNTIADGADSLFAFGSPFIRSLTYQETLQSVFSSWKGSRSELPVVSGLFFMLLSSSSGISFLTDEAGLYSVYHSDDGLVLSSSFLALCSGLSRLSLNSEIIRENLLTGSILGEDTIFNEIRKLNAGKQIKFPEISQTRRTVLRRPIPLYKSREESLDAQANALDSYFKGVSRYAGDGKIDAGITGGYDSRLLLAGLMKWFNSSKISLHTFKRIRPDSDYITANRIADFFQLDLRTVEPVEEDNEGSNQESLRRGMLYSDGQIRTHLFWHERFNTFEYRLKLLDGIGMGMSGIGGEQYRNQERVVSAYRSLKKWIRYYLVERISGTDVVDREELDNLVSLLEKKIGSGLDIDTAEPVNLLYIKRYMNEMYNPGNRGLRASFENRLTHYLLPFADPEVSVTSYGAAEHLGINLDYQARLINRINPELAGIMSGYGYNFNTGEPLRKYAPQIIVENLRYYGLVRWLPVKVLGRKTQRWHNMVNRSPEISRLIRETEKYDLKLNREALLSGTDIGPLLISLGYILYEYRGKIIR